MKPTLHLQVAGQRLAGPARTERCDNGNGSYWTVPLPLWWDDASYAVYQAEGGEGSGAYDEPAMLCPAPPAVVPSPPIACESDCPF